ncbi:MAG: CPBP family intramembrane metalloprotease [Myxococcales bacterium]|nr:CPBP family intramembrane metalloprotease [Myxococcales bacterium]
MPSRQLGVGDALAASILSLALFMLIGAQLAAQGAVGIMAAQLTSFALPALLVTRAKTGSFAPQGLRAFPLHAAAAPLLIGATLWIWNLHWVAPIGADWASIEQIAKLDTFFALESRPLWKSLLLFAIVPAFCEELLHRGLLMPALCKRLGAPAGLVLAALLFGLSHFNLSRLLPTAVLGLIAGGVRLRTGSLWPCMLLHAIYNGSLLVAANSVWAPPAYMAWIAAGATTAGALWLHRTTPMRSDLFL